MHEIFDQFKQQLPDIDPVETQEWVDSLDAVVQQAGPDRARFLLFRLLKRARQLQVGLPNLVQTRYINTISPEQEPYFPGDEAMEHKVRRLIRWNALAMVLRANTRFEGIGGHLSTYASAASLYEVGFNHFFRGNDEATGDQVFFQGHAAPGIYARAFLEGRISEEQLDHFRREALWPGGLSSYPHPRLMPEFWQFPTVSMGLGPMNAIYQARFNRYLAARGLADTAGSRVWAFLGDGEMDEPEAIGALGLAAREGLDNLTFVVNCNLQRLDGPVRGNGKIIQELEATFRGAGWHVIKVIWAREWDDLLARDVDGILVNRMNETLDGDYQKLSVADGAYIREHFFGPDPRLRALVEHLSDDELAKLRRGGHDYRKVYAAYAAAVAHTGAPTVILAKTVKGWTLGPGIEGRNVTHQAKKLTTDELKIFRDRLELADPRRAARRTRPTSIPAPTRPRSSTCASGAGSSAARSPAGWCGRSRLPAPRDASFAELFAGSERPASTTMAFSRLVRNLVRDPEVGLADRADHPGRGPDVRHGPALQGGGDLQPARPALHAGRQGAAPLVPREDRRPDPRGGHHRGRRHGRLHRRGHRLRDVGRADDPVLHLLLDVRLPAHRRPGLGVRRLARTRLHDGRHRRPHHAHRRGPPARRRALAHPGHHDPEHPRLRPGLGLRAGDHRPGGNPARCSSGTRTSSTTSPSTTRTGRCRPSPRASRTASSAACTATGPPRAARAASSSSGRDRSCTRRSRAQQILPRALRRRRRRVERNQLPAAARRCAGGRALEPAPPRGRAARPVRHERPARLAGTDRRGHRLPQGACRSMVARWVERPYTVLGTDGFGRSDTREALRIHFEVSPQQIAYAALHGLCRVGESTPDELRAALETLEIDPDRPNPVGA